MSRRKRSYRIPRHIRLQWLQGNWNRYPDREWAILMGISEAQARLDRILAGFPKYRRDDYVRLYFHPIQGELQAA